MSDDIEVLLIEDNPGDARLIEEMFRDTGELFARIDAGASAAGELRVLHEKRLADGLDRLSETEVDAVLLDLGLPDSTGLDTLEAVAEATEFVPIVVLTGLADEGVGIEAIQHGAQDYLVKDEVTSDLLVRSLYHAIERNRQEREREQRRRQLEALNRLNRIGQDVTHAVITTSTRDDLERAVCERFVESDAYRFAWIGEVNRGTDRIAPRVSAGVGEGYLDEIEVSMEGDETALGPAGTAARTHEVQVVQDIRADPDFAPWRDEALDRGYRSSASVPIAYEDFLYGVLNVYAPEPNTFSDSEIEVFSRLGDVIGHAITALERKDALVSRTVLELEFQVSNALEGIVALSAEHGGRIEVDHLVRSDDAILAYGQAADIPSEELESEAERAEGIEDFRLLADQRDEYEFEAVTTIVEDLAGAVATHGGNIKSAVIDDGQFRFVVEFPPGRDKRQLVELVTEHCDGAVHYAQRTVERSEQDVPSARSLLQERLTEKQQTALETAYFAGFFEWPRESTGEEVAERLGISPATFTQHLRTAEREIFKAFFEEELDPDAER